MERTVVITGGNKGIGLETTKLFLSEGCKIIVIARDFEAFPFNENDNIEIVRYDLSDTKGIPELVKKLGHVDVLINNAGIMNSLPYDSYPEENMERLMNLNLYTPIKLIECLSKSMMSKGYGRIVTTASVAGEIGHPDIWYGVSKAGMINVTKSFAKLFANKGIVINCVAPGPVETEMLNVIPEDRKESIRNNVYTNRFAKPEEVAKAIYWLATDCPEYINGTCIDINNGAFPR